MSKVERFCLFIIVIPLSAKTTYNSNIPSDSTPKVCIAVGKDSRNAVTFRPKNCSTKLKCVFREQEFDIDSTATLSIEEDSNRVQFKELNTKPAVNIYTSNADNQDLREELVNSSSSQGAVVGGVIGATVFLTLILIVVFCVYRRKSKQLKRTPSYREPQIEYSSKRKDSEFEVLNTSGNTNKVGTPPSKPVRRTKSGKGSVRGVEYENIVLGLEDPKLLTRAISKGSNDPCIVPKTKTEPEENEYSHIQGKGQKREISEDQENHNDCGKTVQVEADVSNIYG